MMKMLRRQHRRNKKSFDTAKVGCLALRGSVAPQREATHTDTPRLPVAKLLFLGRPPG
jgi:hypothetical protein